MSLHITLRKLRESIGRATISVPGWPSITFSVSQDEPRQESTLAKVAREGESGGKMDHVILTGQNSIRCTRCGTTQEFPDRTSANVWVAIAKAFDEEHRGCAPSSSPTCKFCMSSEHLAADHVKVTCKFPWQWPGNGDTGLSSRALFNHFTKGRVHEANAPLDPADFGRCYRLLNADFAQGWTERINEMAIYPEWAPIVPHWGEITKLYEKEKDLDSAPKTRALMSKIWKESRGRK